MELTYPTNFQMAVDRLISLLPSDIIMIETPLSMLRVFSLIFESQLESISSKKQYWWIGAQVSITVIIVRIGE